MPSTFMCRATWDWPSKQSLSSAWESNLSHSTCLKIVTSRNFHASGLSTWSTPSSVTNLENGSHSKSKAATKSSQKNRSSWSSSTQRSQQLSAALSTSAVSTWALSFLLLFNIMACLCSQQLRAVEFTSWNLAASAGDGRRRCKTNTQQSSSWMLWIARMKLKLKSKRSASRTLSSSWTQSPRRRATTKVLLTSSACGLTVERLPSARMAGQTS